MFPTLTTLIKTVAGKVVVGAAVVGMGVGAAAAGGADVPSFRSAPGGSDAGDESEQEEDTSEEEMSDEQTSDEQTSDERTSDEGTSGGAPGVVADDDPVAGGGEDSGEDADGEADRPDNHGAMVSGFTQTTELEGCRKGQATAAIARGDVHPESKTLDSDLAKYLVKCQDTVPEAGEETESLDPAEPVDDEEAAGDLLWKDVRDGARDDFHEARQAYVDDCGDEDSGEAGDAAGVDGESDADDDDEMSPLCQQLKADWKQVHDAGKTAWHDARDAERDQRQEQRAAERDERKKQAAESKPSTSKGDGDGKGKGKNG